MKNFTLIIALSVFSLLAYAQNTTDLQPKVLEAKAKKDRMVEKGGFLFGLPFFEESPLLNSGDVLKAGETHKLDSIVSWSNTGVTQTWVHDWRDLFEYDSQMKGIVWLEQEWDAMAGAWENIGKTEVQYGTDGKLSALLLYGVDDGTGGLVLDGKMEVYFSPEEIVDSMFTFSSLPGGDWSLDGKSYYHYNESGRIIQWDIWILDDEDGFVNSLVVKYEYNNLEQMEVERTLFNLNGTELVISTSTHSYNTSGQLVLTIEMDLNYSTFLLENSLRTTYQYNTAGDVSVEIDSDWNGGWEEVTKYENTYGTMDFSEVAFPFYLDFINGLLAQSFKPFKIITEDKTFEMIEGVWVQTDRATYYYSAGSSTSVQELENREVRFYPNPASEAIFLEWDLNAKVLNLNIFQMTGVRVLEQNISSGEKIPVTHLGKGIYLVELLDGQHTVFTGKLMIK